LDRYKGQIVRLAKLTALRSLLNSIFADADDADIEDLARRWFTNKAVRKHISSELRSIRLDETAIEVEAYRLSLGDLAAIDRRLTELALRRDKVFRQIEDYRAGISKPAGSGAHQRFGQEIAVEASRDA
jgi:hypothetical protein